MHLSFEESRVLGAMMEKAMTTPDNYPMSLNAVVVACNQVSNREPITEFSEAEVEMILRGLADEGLAKMVHRPGDRVVKYRQALDEQLLLSPQEASLIAVLMLRGAQTPGELRQRTTRYTDFGSLPELETVLDGLQTRGLVRRLDRQPGQKESRYEHLLAAHGNWAADTAGGHDAAAVAASPAEQRSESTSQVPATPVGRSTADLAAELGELKRRFEELLERLGEDIP